jgi:hypothetical protein
MDQIFRIHLDLQIHSIRIFFQARNTGSSAALHKAVRDGRFSAASRTEHLASGTVRATVDSVGQTFKAYELIYPRLDGQNNTSFLLLRQYKGYANLDPVEKQQQAITV